MCVIQPSDWVKQSLPFSYLAIEATSTDGKSHSVQLYSDVTTVRKSYCLEQILPTLTRTPFSEWLSANTSQPATWSSKTTGNSLYMQVELDNPEPFVEDTERALDGKAYYAMASVHLILCFSKR